MPRTVYAACAATLALGTLFIFVWAPHPWGWEGFDNYHQLALAVARGEPFPTMDVPWGYAYFLAAFYRTFGDHPIIPLLAQAALNSLVPLLTFALACEWFDARTATVAAALVGVLSFNTVYASTQSSDAVCTVVFLLMVFAFVRALAVARGAGNRRREWIWCGVAGALGGIAPQFRPNLILVPMLLALFGVWQRRSLLRLAQMAVLLGSAALMLMPWVVRNYQLTRTILPTSVHGGVQLWYGTLQVGPYINDRSANPRKVFESPAFDYTSLADVPIVVTAQLWCDFERPERVWLAYTTDDDRTEHRTVPVRVEPFGRYTFEIPPPHRHAVVYYHFVATWNSQFTDHEIATPPGGARTPFVYFVDDDHLGDLDRHGDLLDIFDVVRLARHTAWHEPLPFADEMAEAGIRDARDAAAALLDVPPTRYRPVVSRIEQTEDVVRVVLVDGSSLTIPRSWHHSVTDLAFTGELAPRLMFSRVSLRALTGATARERLPRDLQCAQFHDIVVNDVFYRREPQMMRRYSALAWDNIRRNPAGFMLASAYRTVRLFVVWGSDSLDAAQQFSSSRPIYTAATAASVLIAGLFIVGIVTAWHNRRAIALPLVLIAYIPLTLAPVLTNMRYTVTIQPLVFMFVAAALARSAPARPPVRDHPDL
jgi:hypothetical protein